MLQTKNKTKNKQKQTILTQSKIQKKNYPRRLEKKKKMQIVRIFKKLLWFRQESTSLRTLILSK
jgi:hypothetical protein